MLTFPAGLRPIGGGFANFAKTISGGQSMSGIEQVSSSMNDRWTAAYTFKISNTNDLLPLRAFILSMRGRANTVGLPAFDNNRAPWAVVKGIRQTPKIRRDRALDGTPYADPANFNDTLIVASLTAAAAAMATQASIAISVGTAPQPGHLFGLGNRLYSILSVTGAGPYAVEIWPSLRFAAAAGANVSFTSALCEMRFASDTEGASALMGLSALRFGSVTLNFDEAAPIS